MSQKMDFLACQDLSSDILDLARQLSIRIRENRRQQITERFEDVVIHNTEIAKYEKKQ